MKLFFIRHGQTDWNLEGKIQGSCDIELNSTGIAQAEELCRKVSENNYKFSKIYTSKQKRAVKTAEILGRTVHADFVPTDGLEEVNLGKWEGLSWSEVQEKFPEKYEEWYNNRRYTRAPGGESYQDMLERVLKAIHKIIDENHVNVAVITHNAVIMCLQCYLTDTPFDQMVKFKAKNTAIIEIDSDVFINRNSALK